MPKWTYLNDPTELPDPPRYGMLKTKIYSNGARNRSQFAIFDSLALVKASVTNECHGALTQHEYVIYEWDDAGWQQIYSIAQGITKASHELWAKGPAPRHRQTINETEVEAAIASILKAG